MAESNQRKLIIVLLAVLLAVLAASGVVLVFLPTGGQSEDPVTGTSTSTQNNQPGDIDEQDVQGFNLQTLERNAFKELDTGMIQRGLLPVKPPQGTGKANPFL